MPQIDLRSDTVTKPTQAMREAMKNAEVGDDVFEEDPTVIELEAKSAEIMGKESGLFVSSGTMGNLVSLLTHCARGDEVLLARGAHVFQYEVRAASTLGGISLNPLGDSKFSPITPNQIKQNIAPLDVHKASTKLVSLENTLNGIAISKDDINAVCAVAKENNLITHMDGARIFNAACALNTKVSEFVKNVDSVQFCFSKGLSAPVGSMLCGQNSFIKNARRWRKALGGGTRQAGVLAAPCLISLKEMTQRLYEDHENAQTLAKGINDIDHLKVDMNTCQTNMTWIETSLPSHSAHDLVDVLEKRDVLVLAISDTAIRAVTHHGITDSDIKTVISVFHKAINILNDSSKSIASASSS